MDKNTYSKWLEDNPLYEFRQDYNVSRSRVASLLGVSASSIQFWENGGNYPNEENRKKIADLISVDETTLKNKWDNWLEKQPDIKVNK